MKKNTIKFAGPSKQMADALENEGLYVDWPDKINDVEELAIDGMFCTGNDWEKIVLLDFRGFVGSLSTNNQVDCAIANQLTEAYDNFDIDDEMTMYLSMSDRDRELRRVPDSVRLLEDMKEQKARLKRFAEVANAVYRGKPVPPEAAEDGDAISISTETAKVIVELVQFAYKKINPSYHTTCENILKELNRKLGKGEVIYAD